MYVYLLITHVKEISLQISTILIPKLADKKACLIKLYTFTAVFIFIF